MTQILLHLDDDLVSDIRKIVKEKYGGRRGSLSLVVEDALRRSLVPSEEITASNLLEIIDYVSRATKEGQSKDQILTNVFLMLDHEFEQSILRGLEDSKEGRVWTVPKGSDPVDFLHKLDAKNRHEVTRKGKTTSRKK